MNEAMLGYLENELSNSVHDFEADHSGERYTLVSVERVRGSLELLFSPDTRGLGIKIVRIDVTTTR